MKIHDFDAGLFTRFQKYLFLSAMRNVNLILRIPSLWWAAKGPRNSSYFPSTPFYFSPGKEDTRYGRCVRITAVLNIFWYEICSVDFSGFQLNQGAWQHHFRGSWGNHCFYNWGNYYFYNQGNYCVYNWRTWCPAHSTRFVTLSCALLTSFRFSPTKKPRKRGRLVHF